MSSGVDECLPNYFSMCTAYMIYPPRLIYISTSLFNVFHPRRLFSRVFSLLCLFVLCFLQYSFTLSVWSRVFIGAVFLLVCLLCSAKHTTSSVWSPRVVFIIVFSFLCLLLLCWIWSWQIQYIKAIFCCNYHTFISRNECPIIRIQGLRWFEM